MEEESIAQLEQFAKELYNASDVNTRLLLEKNLQQFSSTPDCLAKCCLLLDRSSTPYGQMMATSTIAKLVSQSNSLLSVQQRVEIRNYILNYLATHPMLINYISQALIQLYGRITKQGWFDIDVQQKDAFVFRNIMLDVNQFLNSGTTHHVLIGVQILSQLVIEMNQFCDADINRSFIKQRKIAASFRDTQLFEIFQLGCEMLKKEHILIKNVDFTNTDQHNLLHTTLQLVLNCLNFDFIGASVDESSDDQSTVQVPSSWRTAFLDGSTLNIFFDLYSVLPTTISPLALSCLVQLSSIRRSLFNHNERFKFLNDLVTSIRRILEHPQSLSDASNNHEFCRLLARLKTNFQLGELVKVDDYSTLIKLITEFTITCVQLVNFPVNSLYYLLSLWHRLVAPVPYVKSTEPHLLETFVPEVFKAFIVSRLDFVPIIIRDGLDDPLDDQTIVTQQLEQLSIIGRYEYKRSCELLLRLFDETVQVYYNLNSTEHSRMDRHIQEGRITWLVLMIGAVLGGKISFASCEEHDDLDGQLACRIFKLMGETDNQLPNPNASEKLEIAFLNFSEQFRKIYVGDQVAKSSRVYRQMAEILGFTDEAMIMSVFVRKIITNLKYFGDSEAIISRTLQLLADLVMGYSSVRKLIKLDEISFLLANHKSEHFPFLSLTNIGRVSRLHCRSSFYTSLGRLLMVDLVEDEDRFNQFMMPFAAGFETLKNCLIHFDTQHFNVEETKCCAIGLARDLRGLAFAFNSRGSYMMLYDWLFEYYSALLIQVLEIFSTDSDVTTPVLKLYTELDTNRSQRLQFDVSSPNGILLFREISKVIVTYGTRILNVNNIPEDKLYSRKLKGISICYAMLKAGLSGNYVNFGVFRLYGDSALDNSLETFVKLTMSMSERQLLDHPKVSNNFYALIECISQDHMRFISQLEPQVFLYLMGLVSSGLTSTETVICSSCCSTLDNIITFLFKQLTRHQSKANQSGVNNFLQMLEQNQEVLQQILANVLNVIMFEDCRNQWSMSRPLLGLILLNEECFNKLQANIVESQPTDKRQMMTSCFESLMQGIERNLLTRNRDRFTQNLAVFRHEMNDSVKNTSTQSLNGLSDMMS